MRLGFGVPGRRRDVLDAPDPSVWGATFWEMRAIAPDRTYPR